MQLHSKPSFPGWNHPWWLVEYVSQTVIKHFNLCKGTDETTFLLKVNKRASFSPKITVILCNSQKKTQWWKGKRSTFQ